MAWRAFDEQGREWQGRRCPTCRTRGWQDAFKAFKVKQEQEGAKRSCRRCGRLLSPRYYYHCSDCHIYLSETRGWDMDIAGSVC